MEFNNFYAVMADLKWLKVAILQTQNPKRDLDEIFHSATQEMWILTSTTLEYATSLEHAHKRLVSKAQNLITELANLGGSLSDIGVTLVYKHYEVSAEQSAELTNKGE